MQSHLAVWHFIQQHLQRSEKIMLLFVVQSMGSSPGRKGFCMAVSIDGHVEGSIGGGVMEHKFFELAKVRLKEPFAENTLHRQIHSKTAANDQSGMICSGEQTIAMVTLATENVACVNGIISALLQNEVANIRLSSMGLVLIEHKLVELNELQIESDQTWVSFQKLGVVDQLVIIGGGHCALALSKLMQTLAFTVTLYEDRTGLPTVQQNDYVHRKVFVDDYHQLSDLVEGGEHVYVVVMTVGYRTDDIAIRAIRHRRFRYFGVLGSPSKISVMVAEYRKNGFDENWLNTLSAPAGLPIKSQTPEEIAISIAAEIISIKNTA